VTRSGAPTNVQPLLFGTGTFTSAGSAPQPFNISGTVPALLLTKTVDQATASPGAPVTFTLTLTNAGLGATNGVVVLDRLPTGVTALGATNGGQLQNGAVLWSLGSLAPGASAILSAQVQVPAGSPGGTSLTNLAQVRSNEIPIPVASNAVTVTVTRAATGAAASIVQDGQSDHGAARAVDQLLDHRHQHRQWSSDERPDPRSDPDGHHGPDH
jgi:uncharacterized repeat protein (TIGR01451 family)